MKMLPLALIWFLFRCHKAIKNKTLRTRNKNRIGSERRFEGNFHQPTQGVTGQTVNYFGPFLKGAHFSSFIQTVIETSAELHHQNPRYRPHHLERWPRLSQIEQGLIRQYGTYKLGSSAKPHLSVAQVKDIHIDEAFKIAEDLITLPQEFGVDAIQLVDVGHNNEKWDILCQW